MWKKILTVAALFAISIVIIISLSVYAFQRFDVYLNYADRIDRHHLLIHNLNMLRVEMAQLDNTQRSFLLFNDSAVYRSLLSHENAVKKTFSNIHELTRDDRFQHEKVNKLNFLIKHKIDLLHSGISVGYPPADYQDEIEINTKCDSLIDLMDADEKQLLESQQNSRDFYESTTPENFRLVFILAMIVFAISFGMLIKQYRDRITYQQMLEKNIVELNQANSEWEQIGYVASHDLQEPLRKVRTFSNLLLTKYTRMLDEEGQAIVKRIDVASERAQLLVMDIVNYNVIVGAHEALQAVDLAKSWEQAAKEHEPILSKKGYSVYVDTLPVIRGYPSQIVLMFKCLIENSVKFSKPNDVVKISITASTVPQKNLPVNSNLSFTHYHRILFEDNGIGFENQFADKIFKMFQRLHTQDSKYEGRGIGLAMVKRIMTNHLGIVIAKGRLGKGARFILYFPVH